MRMSREKSVLTGSFLAIVIILTSIILVQAIDWSPDLRLTWDGSDDWHPCITQASDGRIWIVWHSQRTGNYDIFYKTYDPSLVHPWSPDIGLTTDTSVDRTPSVTQTADGKIWAVWSSNRMGNYDIYYTIYDGVSWLIEPERLTTNLNADDFPSILQDSDGKIWIFWSSNRMGDPGEIFCRISSDNGANWSTPTRLTNNQADDWRPNAVEVAGEEIWIVWTRNDDLYYKILYKNMTEKMADTLLSKSSGQNWHPSITCTSSGTVWVVWDSDRRDVGRNSDIFYKIYDGSWSTDTRLTQSAENDLMPSIAETSENKIWITWTSTMFDNVDIYYRTDESFQPHDVAIFSVIPSHTIAYRGEEDVSIEVVTQNHGTEDEVVTIECRADTTLVGSATFNLIAGQLWVQNFIWETSETSSGIYIVSATVAPVPGEVNLGDNSKDAPSTVEIRIVGDVCRMQNGVLTPVPDGRVDLDDFMVAVGQFGLTYLTWDPVWGPQCDVNDDDVVDIDDIMIIALHFGET